MNSEELEVSLRNEFESYLKNVLAEMKQEVSDFQEKFQAEFEKHKSQVDDVFKEFTGKLGKEYEIDNAFKDSVVEHLRLSRDEGARITASAIAEAEEMEKENAAAPTVGFSEIRDAITDICSQDSQSSILKSLVNNASQFTARGAFFIIKNEHFVGWRVFGKEAEMDESAVREIFFPMANETLLSESVRSLSAVEGSYGTFSDDSLYLNKLEFGQPEKMYAIPLIARGRGVAVLYADYGTEGANVNIDALETLVRVAGLTVELLAASQGSKQTKDESQTEYAAVQAAETNAQTFEQTPAYESEHTQSETTPSYANTGGYDFVQPIAETEEETTQEFSAGNEEFSEKEEFSQTTEAETPVQNFDFRSAEEESLPKFEETQQEFAPQAEAETDETEKEYAFVAEDKEYTADYSFLNEPQPEQIAEETPEPAEVEETQPSYGWSQPVESFETQEEEKSFAVEEEPTEVEEKVETSDDFSTVPSNDYAFESNQNYQSEPAQFEEPAPVSETPAFNQWESNSYQETAYDSSRFETTETPVETQSNGFEQTNGSTESFVSAPIETVSTPPARARFGERNVDLPIEVAEDERRSHNDARRFARLLVSEIKLYNEQKVKEGRDSSDLYDRLREAIDRSREMYDKRVQPPVSSKFDYFHYELVSNLAEGDASKLGMSYPGAPI